VLFLSIWLLEKGSKGVDISGALNLPVAVLGIIVSIVLYVFQSSEEDKRSRRGHRRPRPTWKLTALGTVAAIGIGLSLVWWQYVHKPDLHVADAVRLIGGTAMASGGRATLMIPGTPPGRQNLALAVAVTNPSGLGDCVAPAHLWFTPVLDGSAGPTVTATPGTEAKLSLEGATHAAQVGVVLLEQDPSCRVNLAVSEATLFNDPGLLRWP